LLQLVARARVLGISLALATSGVAVPTASSALASEPGSGTTWHVQAGNFDNAPPNLTQEITTFYPARISVHPGDTVQFSAAGGHTVTFNRFLPSPGPPAFFLGNNMVTGNTLTAANHTPGGAMLNSGGFGQPSGPGPIIAPAFTLQIGADAAGSSPRGTTYKFLCAFHRNMSGTITVLPAAKRLPTTDAQNQAIAAWARAADLARGQRALARANRDVEDNQVLGSIGVNSVQGLGVTDILRFAPQSIQITAGESVTWVNKDPNAPHTVTFGEEKVFPAPPGIVPYGGPAITSTSDQANSGFLISPELVSYLNLGSLFPAGVRQSVTYSFPNPGTYHYICALHDQLGMVGTVVVRPSDSGGDD